MLFAAITGAAISYFTRMTEQSQSLTRSDRIKTDRDKLRRRLQTMASLDDAIFRSAELKDTNGQYVNKILHDCLNTDFDTPPPRNPDCTAMLPNGARLLPNGQLAALQWQPFKLVSPEPPPPNTPPNTPPVIFASDNPAEGKFNLRGEPCAGGNDCIFQATSWFWLECQSVNGSPCKKSEYTVRTLVQVKTIANATNNAKLSFTKAGDIPKSSDIINPGNPLLGSNRENWSNKLALSNVLENMTPCPPGFVARGSTERGVKCEPMGQIKRCLNPGDVFLGIDSKGEAECDSRGQGADCDQPQTIPVRYSCNLGGCTQLNPLSINCGTIPGNLPTSIPIPRRLVQVSNSEPACNVQSGPSKKSQPGAFSLNCTVNYTYQCCN